MTLRAYVSLVLARNSGVPLKVAVSGCTPAVENVASQPAIPLVGVDLR
jgi:hypothetical protein